MSTLTTYHEFVLKRDGYLSDLRALENEVKQATGRMSALKISVGIRIDEPKAKQELDRLLKQLQTQVKPITIPVVYQAPGGAPAVGGGYGGGGGGGGSVSYPAPTGSPGSRPRRSRGNVMGRLAMEEAFGGEQWYEDMRANVDAFEASQQAGRAARGRGSWLRRNHLFGNRDFGSMGLLAAGHFAALHVNTLADEISLGVEGSSSNIGRLRDPMAQLKLKRQLIEKEYSGLRGGVNWLYGLLPGVDSYRDKIGALDDAERTMERTEARGDMLMRAQRERTRIRESTVQLERTADFTGQGAFEKRMSGIRDALRKQEEAAQHIDDAWQVLGYRTSQDANQAANRIRAAARRIASVQTREAYRAEDAADAESEARIGETGQRAELSMMRARGFTREAGIRSRRLAISGRLGRLGRAYHAENDPVERARLGREYQAEFAAAGVENAAITYEAEQDERERNMSVADFQRSRANASAVFDLRAAGRTRAAHMRSRFNAIDDRLAGAKSDMVSAIGTEREAEMRKRYDAEVATSKKEREALAAEEIKRINDARFEHEIAASRAALQTRSRDLQEHLRIFDQETRREVELIEDAEEKKAYLNRRSVERRVMQERRAMDAARTFASARNIELQTSGRGGLADAYDIEDDTRRALREAGRDRAARAGAVAMGIARARALIKQQSRPEVFSDVGSFAQNLQERIFNGDADGVRRASQFLKLLEQNKNAIARGDKLPGEDDPFATAEQFQIGAEKFANAVDKAVGAGNIIGIVRR